MHSSWTFCVRTARSSTSCASRAATRGACVPASTATCTAAILTVRHDLCVHACRQCLCVRLCLFLFGFVLEWCTKAELPVSIVTPGFVGKEVGRITQLHDAVETRQLGPMSLQYKDSQALQVPPASTWWSCARMCSIHACLSRCFCTFARMSRVAVEGARNGQPKPGADGAPVGWDRHGSGEFLHQGPVRACFTCGFCRDCM